MAWHWQSIWFLWIITWYNGQQIRRFKGKNKSLPKPKLTSLIARFMGQHGAHLGPTGPRWAPCWAHELCYLGQCTSGPRKQIQLQRKVKQHCNYLSQKCIWKSVCKMSVIFAWANHVKTIVVNTTLCNLGSINSSNHTSCNWYSQHGRSSHSHKANPAAPLQIGNVILWWNTVTVVVEKLWRGMFV